MILQILEMVNAFVDFGSGRVSECLGKIFANTNWMMLQNSKVKNFKDLLMTKSMPNLKYLLQHYQILYSCVLQTVEVHFFMLSIFCY